MTLFPALIRFCCFVLCAVETGSLCNSVNLLSGGISVIALRMPESRATPQCTADLNHLSLVTRKSVFGVCDQLRLKPACSGDETS